MERVVIEALDERGGLRRIILENEIEQERRRESERILSVRRGEKNRRGKRCRGPRKRAETI